MIEHVSAHTDTKNELYALRFGSILPYTLITAPRIIMKRKSLALAISAAVISVYAWLSFSNPDLNEYQQSVLSVIADREADRLAAADRRAVEQEAALLAAQFMAVRYDPHQLDADVIRRNHPLLGSALLNLNQSSGGPLTEKLSALKEQALKRVETTREAMRYSWLVDLTRHTTHNSYGPLSYFSTCLKNMTLSYIGIARRFYERSDNDCGTIVPS